jgi:hypothetical protein
MKAAIADWSEAGKRSRPGVWDDAARRPASVNVHRAVSAAISGTALGLKSPQIHPLTPSLSNSTITAPPLRLLGVELSPSLREMDPKWEFLNPKP